MNFLVSICLVCVWLGDSSCEACSRLFWSHTVNSAQAYRVSCFSRIEVVPRLIEYLFLGWCDVCRIHALYSKKSQEKAMGSYLGTCTCRDGTKGEWKSLASCAMALPAQFWQIKFLGVSRETPHRWHIRPAVSRTGVIQALIALSIVRCMLLRRVFLPLSK
jgi:hypothetical protein